MAVIPNHIVQTSTEAKKQYKKNGVALPARQQKQLQRGLELDQRAARFRDSEERRKAARKKREEKEAKEERARQQMGVGRATQMIGYSHTQAQLKNGMEAFLGVSKRRDQEKRKKDVELTKKLELIAQQIEKEPWDDDETDDIALDMIGANSLFGQQSIDEDVDDDTLLQAHDLVMPDPVEETPAIAQLPPTPVPAPAPAPAPLTSPHHVSTTDDPSFIRTHGPKNKTVEAILDKLPGDLVELLSQDVSMKLPHWSPAPGLLYKLNPVGLPPHRLRIKVGCIVTLLRDLNSSSQLSKNQHLRILRADHDRLEGIVLDGQLKGTKTILTRVPFLAKYRNQDQYPFQRIQFPVRVANDYIPSSIPRNTVQSDFKLPALLDRKSSPSLLRKASSPTTGKKPPMCQNPGFKVPGLPASKSGHFIPTTGTSVTVTNNNSYIPVTAFDGWDDFLESGTQIARELSIEEERSVAKVSVAPEGPPSLEPNLLPPMSTQDLEFSMDDLDNDSPCIPAVRKSVETVAGVEKVVPLNIGTEAPSKEAKRDDTDRFPLAARSNLPADPRRRKSPGVPPKIAGRSKQRSDSAPVIDLRNLRPSQKPLSVGDRPGLKRKAHSSLVPPAKRHCAPASRPVLPAKSVKAPKANSMEDFGMSSQDVACFFDDMDEDDLWDIVSPAVSA
ncbi:hypothetical protein J1614_010857 [Plenodomus biglobosus]|nr:hypothetical protein J1614_010857 [Plenodomus biglobosus]